MGLKYDFALVSMVKTCTLASKYCGGEKVQTPKSDTLDVYDCIHTVEGPSGRPNGAVPHVNLKSNEILIETQGFVEFSAEWPPEGRSQIFNGPYDYIRVYKIGNLLRLI